MYEHLSAFGGGSPNARHIGLYSSWARGGWGIVITGNVQVSAKHLTLGADLVIPEPQTPSDIEPWKKLAAAMHACPSQTEHPVSSGKPISLIQLSHAGRQSPRFVGGRALWTPPMAPSAKRVGENVNEMFFSRSLYRIIFQRPKPMSKQDIDETMSQFLHGVEIASRAGFDGVQLHGSHGCKPWVYYLWI